MGTQLVQITVDSATALLSGLGGAITGFFGDIIYESDGTTLTAFAQFAFVILGVSVALGFVWVLFKVFKR